QQAEIAAVQKKFPDVRIFKGIEADILVDGAMDYPDEVLATFDFVIASVHSRFNLSEEDQTRRICRALANPYVTMLGHPTGRLLLARDGYRVDMRQVLDAAATHGKIVEINANAHRPDLGWPVRGCDGVSTHCRRAGDTAWVPRCSAGRTAGSAGPRRRNAQLRWAMRGQDPRLTLAEPYYSGNLNSRSSTFSSACLTSPCTSSRDSARRTSSRFAWVVGFGGVRSRQQSLSGSIDVS